MTLYMAVQPGQQLRFKYINWRGEPHTYLIEPVAIELGHYTEHGAGGASDEKCWVLHATMIERDGIPRLVGRRTFLLSKMEDAS